MEKPGIDLLLLVFYKQPVYKQVALAWQIAKHLSGLNHKTITSQNISSEAHVKNCFIS